jgi:hypothetical protein
MRFTKDWDSPRSESASIHNGRKTVRYVLRRLGDQAAVAGGSASTE